MRTTCDFALNISNQANYPNINISFGLDPKPRTLNPKLSKTGPPKRPLIEPLWPSIVGYLGFI